MVQSEHHSHRFASIVADKISKALLEATMTSGCLGRATMRSVARVDAQAVTRQHVVQTRDESFLPSDLACTFISV
ncbi:hypothetical protein V6N11_018261 [Hibiscus sabdariffa]|uniref:Uncharacterized protein n=1 Tax=Hibiscus sabdariffa TaxID=183260 RepID=A0ABR2T6W6_9ROSI